MSVPTKKAASEHSAEGGKGLETRPCWRAARLGWTRTDWVHVAFVTQPWYCVRYVSVDVWTCVDTHSSDEHEHPLIGHTRLSKVF